jgi:hypothetical protein
VHSLLFTFKVLLWGFLCNLIDVFIMEVKVPVDCISQLALIPMIMQVHGKLNTHTGEAHGVAQLKRKFYPEV